MLLSIIVPTCNRNALLNICLESLASGTQTIHSNLYEVIITDDSKENLAKSLIDKRFHWATWIEGPKKGPAANRNNGAKYAIGEWLVFLDDDCIPNKNWLQSYIENFTTNYVLEGRTIAERPKQRFDEEAPLNLTGGNLWSCNFAIKKKLFDELNGFDETFPFAAMEDVDFHIRVTHKSKVLFLPDAVVVHPWRRVPKFKSFKKHYKSFTYFKKKWGSKRYGNSRITRFKIFIGSIYYDLRELAKFSFKGWVFYVEKCLLNFSLIFC